jgi:dienelactone hydrolase
VRAGALAALAVAWAAAAAAQAPAQPPPAQQPAQAAAKADAASAGPAAASAPAGAEGLAVQWFQVPLAGGRRLLAAVARPPGLRSFPAVVILHGTHGFAREYVTLATDLARAGVIGIAACWFAPGSGVGMRFVTPIGCPGAPPLPKREDASALDRVDALLDAVGTLPGVKAEKVALFGHSRGAGLALSYALARKKAHAVVLDSGGYPDELAARAAELAAPLLVLHGTADRPDDGGSAMTAVAKARAFEAAVTRAGGRVEAKYYAGAGHNALFTDPVQNQDEVERVKAFLARAFK